MAMTLASAFPRRSGERWKLGSVRAENGGIPAPGSASRTLSGMAGTPSVAPSKPHGSCGELRRLQRLREKASHGRTREKAGVCYNFFRQMALRDGRSWPCSSYAAVTST